MEREGREEQVRDARQDQQEKIPYVVPGISTLSEEQILEEIGPAWAYTGTMPFNF